MPKANAPSERRLQELWARHDASSAPLATDDGRAMRIIFPGWPNNDSGPDFHGAIVQDETGQIARGDVELHLTPAGWRQHGHHRDAAYARVMLQVVWKATKDSRSHSQGTMPTAVFTPELSEGGAPSPRPVEGDPRPCVHHADSWDDARMGALLDAEGDARFTGKAAACAASIEAQGEEQALYIALCEALGYAKNIEPFRLLAERMPLARLRSIAVQYPREDRFAVIEGLLFGAAGLLPSQRTMQADSYAAQLETIWRAHRREERYEPLPWRRFRIRPENAPARRIAGAARFVERCAEGGLVPGAEAWLGEAIARETSRPILEALTIPDDGYWATHLDFDTPCAAAPTLLGRSRAMEIVVNVVLPFFSAIAQGRHDPALAEGCRRLYAAHAPLAENHITQRMEGLLLPGRARTIVTSARRQQGLIGLYKSRCFELKCDGCVFAQASGGDR